MNVWYNQKPDFHYGSPAFRFFVEWLLGRGSILRRNEKYKNSVMKWEEEYCERK